MNDKQIEIMAECANFLAINSISRNFFYEMINEAFFNHEWMDKRLGLNEDNDFRVIIPTTGEIANEKDEFIEFVKEICRIKSENTGEKWTIIDKTFIQDEKKNKYKVTKLLNLELWQELILSSIGKKMAADSNQVICCLGCSTGKDPESTRHFLAGFRIWYGEQIKDGTNIILSCNPLDILRASSNSTFQSCYRPDGEWFNGVLSSLISPNTLISGIEEFDRPGYKIGRSWIYVNEEQIVCGRKYGSILEKHHLYIRSYLYSKMGGSWKHRSGMTIGEGHIVMDGPGYLDRSYGSTSLIKHVSQDYSKITPISIPKAICLFCGKKYNDYGARGVCRACISNVKGDILKE